MISPGDSQAHKVKKFCPDDKWWCGTFAPVQVMRPQSGLEISGNGEAPPRESIRVCVYTCLCPQTGGAGGPAEKLIERNMRILAWEVKLMLTVMEKLTREPVWMWRVGFPRPVPHLWWRLTTSRQCVLGTVWNKGLSTGTHCCLEYRFLKAIWQCVSGLKGPYPLTQ